LDCPTGVFLLGNEFYSKDTNEFALDANLVVLKKKK